MRASTAPRYAVLGPPAAATRGPGRSAEIVGSRIGGPSDYLDMSCAEAREAISALLDGDPSEVDREALEAHLASCASCRAWQEAAHRLTRLARLQRSPAPRPSPQLYEALHGERSQGARPRQVLTSIAGARVGLAAVAVGQLVLSVPLLVLGDDRSAPVHVAHEMGSLEVAVAIGFLAAVRRPARAVGMLTLIGVAALLLVLTATVDLVAGHTTLLDEAPHLMVVAGWILLWRLAGLAPPSDERPRSVLATARAATNGVLARLLARVPVAADAPAPPDEEPATARRPSAERTSKVAG